VLRRPIGAALRKYLAPGLERVFSASLHRGVRCWELDRRSEAVWYWALMDVTGWLLEFVI
jgi:hypothetical protein